MKGFITKTASGVCLCIALTSLAGCVHYRELVDPCWPERYNSMARGSVRDFHNAQAEKGHLLQQTVWNWMFETDPKTGNGTDRLSGAGMERLRTISRTLPVPDFQLFIQNAQDLPYIEGTAPDKLVQQRNDLNNRRIASIQRFMATQTNTPGNFQVAVHDFAPTGIPANVITGSSPQNNGVLGAYQKLENNFQGAMQQMGGQGGGSGGGSSMGGSSGGR